VGTDNKHTERGSPPPPPTALLQRLEAHAVDSTQNRPTCTANVQNSCNLPRAHLEEVVVAEAEEERVGSAVAVRGGEAQGVGVQRANEIRGQTLPLPRHLSFLRVIGFGLWGL